MQLSVKRSSVILALLAGTCLLNLSWPMAEAKSTPKPESGKHLQSFSKKEKAAKDEHGKNGPKEHSPEPDATSQPAQSLHVYESQQDKIASALSRLTPETQKSLNLQYQAMQEQAKIVGNELRDEEEVAVQDIGMLWQAAVERSATIRYAIEKLSRKDSTGKPVSNDSATKRILQSVTRLGGVAGSMMTGTSGALGSNMIEEAMRSDPMDPSTFKVGDADMLLLAKEVEALQNQVIEAYYQYRHAQTQFQLAKQSAQSMSKQLKPVDEAPSFSERALTNAAMKSVMESFYQASKQDETNAAQHLTNTRNVLGLLVGADALAALEQSTSK